MLRNLNLTLCCTALPWVEDCVSREEGCAWVKSVSVHGTLFASNLWLEGLGEHQVGPGTHFAFFFFL